MHPRHLAGRHASTSAERQACTHITWQARGHTSPCMCFSVCVHCAALCHSSSWEASLKLLLCILAPQSVEHALAPGIESHVMLTQGTKLLCIACERISFLRCLIKDHSPLICCFLNPTTFPFPPLPTLCCTLSSLNVPPSPSPVPLPCPSVRAPPSGSGHGPSAAVVCVGPESLCRRPCTDG